jgi:hypothetical protein
MPHARASKNRHTHARKNIVRILQD